MEFFLVQTLNGISYGLLLFMLSSGLTLVFSLMGVLNFAQHVEACVGEIEHANEGEHERQSRRKHE